MYVRRPDKNNHREASNNYCYLAQSADEVNIDAIVINILDGSETLLFTQPYHKTFYSILSLSSKCF